MKDRDRREMTALGGLVLLAFALRAWGPGLVHFGIDEAGALRRAVGWIYGGVFPWRGIPTSFGFHNPPTLVLLLAPLVGLTPDPRVLGLLPMGLGAASVVFGWRAGRLAGGRRAALATALIVAVCPSAVEHGRRLWGHDFMVFFSAVVTWAVLEANARGRSWPLGIGFAAAAIAQSLHLSGALLWLPGLGLLAVRRRRWDIGALGAGMVLLGLVYTPWLVAEAREGWPDTVLLWELPGGGRLESDLGIPVDAWAAWTTLLADMWHNDLLGAARPWMVSPLAGVAAAVTTAMAVLFLALALTTGSYTGGRPSVRRVRRHVPLLLPVIATPVVFGGLVGATVPPYQLPALVPMAVLAAAGLVRVGRRAPGLAVTLLVVYTVASVVLVAETRRALAAGAGTSVPLREQLAVVDWIARDSGGATVALLQNGRPPAAGIDVGLDYLTYRDELFRRMGDVATAQRVYVIRERMVRLDAAEELVLRRARSEGFHHLVVTHLGAEERVAWLSLVGRGNFP